MKLITLSALAAASATLALAQGTGYWHTSGNRILDANNQVVRITGVNWYGFETTDEVAHGLWAQDYKSILNAIRSNGYNTVRLPFSNQMVESPIVPPNISYNGSGGAINSDLRNLNSLQVMDKIIAYAGQIGLRVILDNHRSEAGNSAEANGLWYTSQYPESTWINDWVALANRYKGNPTVIGADLRNEPHNATSGGASWGTGTNDWRLAAQRGGNAVLAANPDWLIFVEGTDCFNGSCDWWGGNLQGVQQYPVQLSNNTKLVYSAHDYGPNEYGQSWFNSGTTAASLQAVWVQELGVHQPERYCAGMARRIRNHEQRFGYRQLDSRFAGAVVPEFDLIPERECKHQLDLLGAERGRQLRPAKQQLRQHSGECGQTAGPGVDSDHLGWRRSVVHIGAKRSGWISGDGSIGESAQLELERIFNTGGLHNHLYALFEYQSKQPDQQPACSDGARRDFLFRHRTEREHDVLLHSRRGRRCRIDNFVRSKIRDHKGKYHAVARRAIESSSSSDLVERNYVELAGERNQRRDLQRVSRYNSEFSVVISEPDCEGRECFELHKQRAIGCDYIFVRCYRVIRQRRIRRIQSGQREDIECFIARRRLPRRLCGELAMEQWFQCVHHGNE